MAITGAAAGDIKGGSTPTRRWQKRQLTTVVFSPSGENPYNP